MSKMSEVQLMGHLLKAGLEPKFIVSNIFKLYDAYLIGYHHSSGEGVFE